jgi:uncharacterized protein YprB with RNaseH-like and TPR domain
MSDEIKIINILFIDIETVPQVSDYNNLNERIKKLWNKKIDSLKKNTEETPEILFEKAGIYAEFGKIICISAGFIQIVDTKKILRLKSFFDNDEKKLLQDFKTLLDKSFSASDKYLCAHNGKEFDFPYIARRMLINGIKLPLTLDIAGKKPWEIKHLDTLELWKFGDYKHYTSLDLLTAIFDIPSPKDDIDGSEVAGIYWKENDIDRIVKYCEKDVLAVTQLYLKYKNIDIIDNENIRKI